MMLGGECGEAGGALTHPLPPRLENVSILWPFEANQSSREQAFGSTALALSSATPSAIVG